MDRFVKELKSGTYISTGQQIGYLGSTGNAKGPHLHLEYWVGSKPINPKKLFLYQTKYTDQIMKKICLTLLKAYGNQGWWPIDSKNHPKDYSIPKDKSEQWEIIVGTILTQNTSWNNVDKALQNLRQNNSLKIDQLNKIDKNNRHLVFKKP